MSQLDTLGWHVSQKIKARGRSYFERKTVKILYADTEFVSAQVSGTQEYAVDLEREQKTLIFSCDCPFFEDNFKVCKHVWATLLELERLGHFKKWESRFPNKLVPTSSDLGPDEEDVEDLDFEDETEIDDEPETGSGPRAAPRRSWTSTTS